MVNFTTDDTVLPTFRIGDKGDSSNIKHLWRRGKSSDNISTQSSYEKVINYTDGNSESMNQSSSDVLLKSIKSKQPQHNFELGGPRSSFVPVRVPSNDIVGKIDYEKNLDIAKIKWKHGKLMKNSDNLKFDNLMQSWEARDHRGLNMIERNETVEVEYKFRPIVPNDEKRQIFLHDQRKAKEIDFNISKNVTRKMPLLEVCFRDDESFDSLSSMGYDGDEHDLDAIFKDEMYETECLVEDEIYFEGKLLTIVFLFFDVMIGWLS